MLQLRRRALQCQFGHHVTYEVVTKHWAALSHQERPAVNTPTTSVDRTRAYRKRLAEQGFTTLSISVDGDTARGLRAIAREHKQSMGDVLKMGSLLTLRALADLPRNVAE